MLILGALVAAPFLLEAKFGSLLRNNVNKNINGTFDFDRASLSLIRSFPNVELTLDGMYILNKSPFEGDTLISSEKVSLTMGLGELFKGEGEPIGLKNLAIEKALLNILIDAEEHANYDLALDTEPASSGSDSPGGGFTLDLQSYSLSDSEIRYTDLSSGIMLRVQEIQHQGTGDLSLDQSELQTTTTALVSLEMDSTNYLNRNSVELEALIGIDLKANKYSFLKNQAMVNQLPLVFEGYVQLFEDHQQMDIRFSTSSSEFKNFLAVIPETYTRNIEGVTTTGDFTVQGEINGRLDDTHIPMFSIALASDNASFKYPDLPKAVRNIHIDALVKNTTGLAEDTYVAINKASFTIDSDQFNLRANLRELMGNTRVDAHIDGNMDLANLQAAYPVPADLNLKGFLKADINTAFDMASVENKQYEKTKTQGYFNLRNFEYASPELANPVNISSMTVEFNPKTVTLKEMNGQTGRTDFKVSGTLHNLLGFMFNKELVEGNFNLNSNTFVLNDFMVADATAGQGDASADSGEEQLKIPSFLDCTVQASANTVHYDNLTLKEVSGTLRIKDETASLSNFTSAIFDGKLALKGTVSTKEAKPTFAMQLGMDGFRISETFQSLELFQALAPVANALQGRLSSQINISGLLTDDFTPDLATISGDALAQLLGTELQPEKAAIVNALGGKLNFLSASDFNLKGLKTALSFENGRVNVKPFTVNYKDIAIKVDGGHGFDRSLKYTATLQVPAKYLGSEVNNLIAKLDEQQLQNLSIPITANIGGNYTNPVVSTDLTSGVKALTTQLVEIQKQKLVNQGKSEAQKLIGGLLSGATVGKDSVPRKDSTGTGVKDVVGGLLGKATKPADTAVVKKDSAATRKEPVREAAKEIIGGFLSKKKKPQETKKDSLNP